MNIPKRQFLHISLIIAALIIGIVFGILQVKPPAPPSEGAAEYPAFHSMMINIEKLAEAPHPSGSAEIEVVRAEIISEIEKMGLTPITQNMTLSLPEIIDYQMRRSGMTRDEFWEQIRESAMETYGVNNLEEFYAAQFSEYGIGDTIEFHNILVKLDAQGTERGVMFVAHYDSVPTAPGAADDMTGVCAILETIRAYAQNDALENDMYFLITDGEELGLFGAWAFTGAHPELKDKIDFVVNLEARGNRGGLLLYETSPDSYSVVKAVIGSGAKPIGFSIAAAVYSMMSSDTDFTVFLNSGYKGVNLAVIEGVEHYHQPTDNYDNLNRASAWHYLHTALALADYAAKNSLDSFHQPSTEAVYFMFFPGIMVFMSAMVSHLLFAAACFVTALYAVFQIKKKTLKISFLNISICLLLLFSVVSTIIFPVGSYIFYFPLFVIVITILLKKWQVAHVIAQMASCIVILLIWVPAAFLLWVSLIQPMIL